MPTETIGIYFILDGKDYAFKTWPAVPRLGEFVMMHPAEGPRVHEVLEVVWGVRGPDDPLGRVTCNVRIGPAQSEPRKAPRGKKST